MLFQSNKTTLTWQAPTSPGLPGTVVYDVLRSTKASDFGPAFAVCLATDISVLTVPDATTPAPGQVFFYLTRAGNPCAEGSLGIRAPGVERTGRACAGAPLGDGPEPPNGADGADLNVPRIPTTKNAGGVYIDSGEYFYVQTDLRIPGRGFDFVWRRKYRSRQERLTAMGYNWNFSYDVRVELSGAGNVDRALYGGDGRRDTYTPVGGDCWNAPGFFRGLCRELDGSYTLTFPDFTRWKMKALDGSPTAGKLLEIRDRNDNVMGFAYDGTGRLATVTDTLGRAIQVGYNPDGFISTVTDFAGRQVSYAYYQNADPGGAFGDLKSWTTPAVTGTPNGNDFPSGKTTTYTYSKGQALSALNHNLLTITDGLGQLYAQNSYTPGDNPLDRLEAEIFHNGTINYTYLPQTPGPGNNLASAKTIVNDRAGNVREAFFDTGGRLVMLREFTGRAPNAAQPTDDTFNRPVGPLRPTDPSFFETRYAYNADSLRTRLDRPNGDFTLYTYDSAAASRRSQGNLLTRQRNPGPLGADQGSIVESWQYEGAHNFVNQETDGRGNFAAHTYDPAGNRTHTQERLPSILHDWEYNGFGQVTAHVLPDNGSGYRRRDEFTYYATGLQLGYLQSERVDASGLNLTTTYEYDAAGNVVRVVDPRGFDALFAVNALNQLVRERTPETSPGSGVRYLRDLYYDAASRMFREDLQNRDESGAILPNAYLSRTFQYDALDRRLSRGQEVDSGTTITEGYGYDANDNVQLNQAGEAVGGGQPANTVKTLYDERDLVFRRIRAQSDPDQSTTQSDYDGNGNVRTLREGVESSPRVTVLTYDGLDRRTTGTDAMGNVTTWHYDGNGNVLSERTDGELLDVPGSAGNVRLSETTYQYDPMDRSTAIAKAFFNAQTQAPIGDGQATTQTLYTALGDVNQVVDDNAHATSTTFDGARRRALRTDAKGNTVGFAYDANGNVTTVTETEKSDLGNLDQVFATQYAYDGLNRMIQETDNVGNVRSYAYDSRGNRVRTTDALNRESRTTYDGANRRLQEIVDMNGSGASPSDSADIVTGNAWDASSRLTAQSDDNGHTTALMLDALDRETGEDMADCTQPTTTYDVHGNRLTDTDANGTVVNYTYDDLNRLVHKTIAAGSGVATDTTFEDYRYDGLSRLVQAQNDRTSVTREYDSLGGVLRETQSVTGGGPAAVINAVFDGVGNQTLCAYPGGRVVATSYDALDRKKTISDGSGPIASYDYIGPARVERRSYGNGTRTDWQYDGILPNPPGDQGLRQVARTTHRHVASGTIVDDRTYAWDGEGNKVRRKDVRSGGPGFTHNFVADAADRLVQTTVLDSASVTVRDTVYALDGVGNRVSVTGAGTWDAGSYGADPVCPVADYEMNQYTTTPVSSRTYDENGNLKTMAGQAVLKYDYDNRMVEYSDLTSGKRHLYVYDALGRRVVKVENADGVGGPPVRTRFLLDGPHEIEEEDASGGVLASYVQGNYIDEIVSIRRAGGDAYLHEDDLYNVMALTDASGTVIERYEYDDYGRPLSPTTLAPVVGPPSAFGNPFLFNGHRYDAETGWYFYRTRSLDPRSARFTTRDRSGIWGDPGNHGNAFAFVGNNPGSRVDPFGENACQLFHQYMTSCFLYAVGTAAIDAVGAVGAVATAGAGAVAKEGCKECAKKTIKEIVKDWIKERLTKEAAKELAKKLTEKGLEKMLKAITDNAFEPITACSVLCYCEATVNGNTAKTEYSWQNALGRDTQKCTCETNKKGETWGVYWKKGWWY